MEVDRFLCCKGWDIINILIDAFLDIDLLFGYTWVHKGFSYFSFFVCFYHKELQLNLVVQIVQ